MAKNRIFTEAELKEMGKITRDYALEAIEAGDKEKAKKLVNQMGEEARVTLDSNLDWVATLLDYIYVNHGAEALEKALRKRFERTEGKRIQTYPKMSIRDQVLAHTSGLKKLLERMEVTEDDEKICFKMTPCGSGQRLLDTGAYGPPRNICRMKPHRLTWGNDDFPIYCSHGALQEILAIEQLGHPLYVHWFPKKVASESCRFCFYKDPERIPEEVYTRIGKKKPQKVR